MKNLPRRDMYSFMFSDWKNPSVLIPRNHGNLLFTSMVLHQSKSLLRNFSDFQALSKTDIGKSDSELTTEQKSSVNTINFMTAK